MNVFSKVFGTHSQREVKRIMPLVEKTESLRPEMQKLTDEELREKQENIRSVWQREKPWMIFCLRRLQQYVRRQDVSLAWSITVCRSSAVLFFIRAVSQR